MSAKIQAGKSFLPKITININDEKSFNRGLNLVKFTAAIVHGAFDSFLSRRFGEFDALVGENACQARVCLVLNLQKESERNDRLANLMKEDIEKAKKIIEKVNEIQKQLFDRENIPGLLPYKEQLLEGFCSEHDFKIEIFERYEFLLTAFLLNKTRSMDPKRGECTVSENLLGIAALSKEDCRKIVKSAQKSLSEESVKYLQHIACFESKKMMSESFVLTDERGIQCLPCFFGIEVILKKLLKDSIPIVITFKKPGFKKSILFKAEGKNFIQAEPDISDFEKPAFVIEGTFNGSMPDYPKFLKSGLRGVILANAAQHPQYFGKIKDIGLFEIFDLAAKKKALVKEDAPKEVSGFSMFKAEKRRFLLFKSIAACLGCLPHQPGLFCINHILCAPVGKALGDEQ